MDTISLAEAKAKFSELVERVEAGETVQITKRGKPVAQIAPASPAFRTFNASEMKAVTDRMTYQETSAGEFVRWMRDTDRY